MIRQQRLEELGRQHRLVTHNLAVLRWGGIRENPVKTRTVYIVGTPLSNNFLGQRESSNKA